MRRAGKIVALAVGLLCAGPPSSVLLAQSVLAPFLVSAGASPGLLQIADLSCAGVFLSPYVNQGAHTGDSGPYPTTYRYESGHRHYFTLDGHGIVWEYPEPATLSSCSTALGSVTRASLEGWGGNWGTPTVNAGDNFTPGNGATWNALHSDATNGDNLFASWAANYVNVGNHNGAATLVLNDTAHTIAVSSCWGVTNIPMSRVGSGVINIPADFVAANLPSGYNYATGQGWYIASVTSGSSEGPTMYALPLPSSNACASNTDYFQTATTMSDYQNNTVGPNCAPPSTLGCTPSQAPTLPYAEQIAYTNYSKSTYANDWEPYGGHGWAGFGTVGNYDWYEDLVKKGIVMAFLTSEGWANSTIVSSSSTTAAVISSLITHEGYHANVGDYVWLQTCTPGTDPGCSTVNGGDVSAVTLDTVNYSTGAITYTVVSSDPSSGNHFAVPGGFFNLGCTYYGGNPGCSRWELRMQVFDPATYAQVIAGSLQPSQPVASDDQEIDTTLIPQFGTPSTGGGITYASVAGVMADPTAQQIMVAISNNSTSSGQTLIAVLNVAHTPAPLPLTSLWKTLASMGPINLLARFGWRR